MSWDETEFVWNGFPKSQILRIVMQMLLDMGYSDTVASLEKESGYVYRYSSISRLEEAIRSDDMKEARSILSKLKMPSDIRMACSFLCSQQSFAAALHKNDIESALTILRDDLSTSAFDKDTQNRVQLCASLLAYPSAEHVLKTELNWEAESSLRNLWLYIQQLISPDACLPPNRLLTLLRQAVELQELYCPNHRVPKGTLKPPSLYMDHTCHDSSLPPRCIARLDGHVDEVWDIALSPNEKYVVTGGMDKSVILWNATHPFDIIHIWKEHTAIVISVSWSYDSALCASLANSGVILLWSPDMSKSVAKIEPDVMVHSFVHWIPGQWSLLTGGDARLILYDIKKRHQTSSPSGNESDPTSSTEGNAEDAASPGSVTYTINVVNKLTLESRVRSLTVNVSGTLALFSTPDCMLHSMDLRTFKELQPIQENATITMLTCSSLYNQVLVSVAGQHPVLRLWDMDERRLIQTYHGHREERYVLKPAMGGPGECYIVSGSEDTQIYIWNKLFGTLIAVIGAHSSTVNAVAWSMRPNALLFSASDDGQLGIWDPLPSEAKN